MTKVLRLTSYKKKRVSFGAKGLEKERSGSGGIKNTRNTRIKNGID